MRHSAIRRTSGQVDTVRRGPWVNGLLEDFWTTKYSSFNLAKKYDISQKTMYKIVGEQHPECCYFNSTVLKPEYHLGYRREKEKIANKNNSVKFKYNFDDLVSRKNIIDLRTLISYK